MRNKKLILVVDDDEMLLDVTKELLANEQYEIMTHRGSVGVMNLVRRFQPDLVLLDINMPILSGEMLSMMLRAGKNGDKTRIVFYSSNDEDSLRESVSAYGVHGYICKGDIANLRHQVDGFIRMPCC